LKISDCRFQIVTGDFRLLLEISDCYWRFQIVIADCHLHAPI
jgi:hypothetical protein